ncbi:T9SS type A sorting domain-containing protein [Nostoc ellipsosporum NOK]|nr:T9SS type A sorting domain-containing protein [Nostoc ellipsosporum NOK]
MKQLLLLLLLLCQLVVQAAPPTTPSSAIRTSGVDGDRMTLTWTMGNGSRRIVVMTTSNNITGRPVNGVDYTENDVFGQGNTLAPGEYIVGDFTGNTLNVYGLQPATTYHVAIFEYSGSGFSTEYLSTPGTGSVVTASTPVTQVSALNVSNIEPNKADINWTKGSGSQTIIVMREGSPVTSVPSDLRSYSPSSSFGSGTQIGPGNYVVYTGPVGSNQVANLKSATTYYVSAFSYNGYYGPVYLTPGVTTSFTTADRPTQSANSFRQYVVDGLSLQAIWNSGNGSHRIMVASENGPITGLPVDGTDYAENAILGQGATIAPGEYVVYDGNYFISEVKGLEPRKDYYFQLFEYIVVNGVIRYRTIDAPRGVFSTAKEPTLNVSNPFATNLRADNFRLNFSYGNGNGRLVLIKKGSPVDASPEDLIKYTSSQSYGSGSEIGNGNFVNSGDNVTNLEAGTTYHFAFYEFNGTNNPIYIKTPTRFSVATLSKPTVAPSGIGGTSYGASLRVGWTRGNGNYCIVIGKKGGAVTSVPADDVTYTGDPILGNGTQIAPDEFVLFAGNNNACDVYGLTAATAYSFRVFEYNIVNGKPAYYTDAFASATISTLSPPTVQSSNIVATTITQTSITLSWNPGNGSGSLMVGKANSAVDREPEDGILYGISASFGSGQTLGNANYTIDRSAGNVTVTNLQPGTTYHFAAFGYTAPNTFGPAFQRTNPARASFTTLASISTPTTPASNLQFSNVEGNKIGVSWTNGNGTNRIVVARANSAVTFDPADASVYTANAALGTGTDLGGGQYIVYNGNSNNFDVTNLQPGTTYYFEVFEFNGTGVNTKYLTTSTATGSRATISAPSIGASTLSVSNVTSTQATVSWTNGNGDRRLVLIRANDAVTGTPANLLSYAANTTFGSGTQVGTGNYAVYANTGSSVTITGLTAGQTYHIAVFEYNGNSGPVYIGAPLRGSLVTIGAPATAATNLVCAPYAADSARLQWNNGSGQYRIVLARKISTVNQVPVNDHDYLADIVFGSGELLGTDVYVVYKGNGSAVTVKGLQGNSTYHFAVFEYNDFTNGVIRYQASNPARSSVTMPITLPLVLNGFGVRGENGYAKLSWSTAWESNLDRFDITVSRDGTHFEKLGETAARNLNDQQHYQYEYQLPESGTYYFRLRMIDKDSSERFSSVATLTWQSRDEISLYPNPAGEQLIVTRRTAIPATWQMIDMNGRVIKTGSLNGLTTIIPLTGIKNGSYVLRFINNGRPVQSVFIKK